MHAVLAQMFEKGAAGGMHNAFGHARGAGREHNVQGMRERQPGELHAPTRPRADRIRPGLRALAVDKACIEALDDLLGATEIGNDDDPAQRRQPAGDRCEFVGDVDRLAVVVVAIAGDEDLRLDLTEAIEHALNPEIGRTG